MAPNKRNTRRITLGALLVGTMTLAACGGWRDARVNPRNWFGGSEETTPVEAEYVNPLLPQEEEKANLLGSAPEEVDRGVAIARITDLRVERTDTGAIILATGEAKRLGAYKAELVRDETVASDELVFVFRVTYPEKATYAGSPTTRTIRAAASVSNQDLTPIRVIRVIGAENARETRR